MSKIRMNRAEAAQIQEVADRLAERTNQRFVFDTNKVEIVEEKADSDSCASPSQVGGLNLR